MKLINLILSVTIVILFVLNYTAPVAGIPAYNDLRYWEHAPPSVQMVEFMLKYSKEEDVPYGQMKRAAYLETTFQGLYDFTYNPAQTSSGNAEGPMQILYSTAKLMYPDSTFSRKRLREDIPFNVQLSAIYAKDLHQRYRNWLIVWSFYNQGAIGINNINSYARYICKT